MSAIRSHADQPRSWMLAGALLLASSCAKHPNDSASGFGWPPVIDQPYPNLVLKDLFGDRVELASLRGKVLLIEPIGMT